MAKVLTHFLIISLFLDLLVATASPAAVSADSDSQATVASLPGFEGPLPFYLETGYIGVGEGGEDQFFYYFVESERNPREDPLLLWLTGGPGCTVLSAFMFEIGPLQFKNLEYHGSIPPLELNPHSWTKVSNIIFVDQPVGTGFSYSRGKRANQSGDRYTAAEIFEFLRKWLKSHPQFQQNSLYIGGDSYAGKMVPILVLEILNSMEVGLAPVLNLKGYMTGNGITDKQIEDSSKVPFAHGMALISDELYESAKQHCEGVYIKPTNPNCARDLDKIHELVVGVEENFILDKHCPSASPHNSIQRRSSLQENHEELIKPQPTPSYGCRTYLYLLSDYWANNLIVQEALNIRQDTIGEWLRCNENVPYKIDVLSTIEHNKNATMRGCRALVYSGDHDMVVPFVGTQAWIRSLNFSIVDDWRQWIVDGQVAGYTRTYSNNLTFATIKGAGHMAPAFKPRECFEMYHRWISNSPL